jgi:hypothetical protein
MTFAAVGSPFLDANSTFSLTPHGVGNLILAEVNVKFQTDVHPTGLSSSNVTWTQIGTTFTGPVAGQVAAVYAGVVTSTSTATVTVSFDGAIPDFFQVEGQEFSSTVGSWALDVQGHIDSGGTNTWASLTRLAPGSCTSATPLTTPGPSRAARRASPT